MSSYTLYTLEQCRKKVNSRLAMAIILWLVFSAILATEICLFYYSIPKLIPIVHQIADHASAETHTSGSATESLILKYGTMAGIGVLLLLIDIFFWGLYITISFGCSNRSKEFLNAAYNALGAKNVNGHGLILTAAIFNIFFVLYPFAFFFFLIAAGTNNHFFKKLNTDALTRSNAELEEEFKKFNSNNFTK